LLHPLPQVALQAIAHRKDAARGAFWRAFAGCRIDKGEPEMKGEQEIKGESGTVRLFIRAAA
jgi:hypothetical protein